MIGRSYLTGNSLKQWLSTVITLIVCSHILVLGDATVILTILTICLLLQFFTDVFVRMFTLQNPNYNFTEPYLGCVGDKMKEIKPFGAYPEQLQRNLKQALVASRTYIQGIAVGRNVVIAAQKVSKYEWWELLVYWMLRMTRQSVFRGFAISIIITSYSSNSHAMCEDLCTSPTHDQWSFSTQQSNTNPDTCAMCLNTPAQCHQGHM